MTIFSHTIHAISNNGSSRIVWYCCRDGVCYRGARNLLNLGRNHLGLVYNVPWMIFPLCSLALPCFWEGNVSFYFASPHRPQKGRSLHLCKRLFGPPLATDVFSRFKSGKNGPQAHTLFPCPSAICFALLIVGSRVIDVLGCSTPSLMHS